MEPMVTEAEIVKELAVLATSAAGSAIEQVLNEIPDPQRKMSVLMLTLATVAGVVDDALGSSPHARRLFDRTIADLRAMRVGVSA